MVDFIKIVKVTLFLFRCLRTQISLLPLHLKPNAVHPSSSSVLWGPLVTRLHGSWRARQPWFLPRWSRNAGCLGMCDSAEIPALPFSGWINSFLITSITQSDNTICQNLKLGAKLRVKPRACHTHREHSSLSATCQPSLRPSILSGSKRLQSLPQVTEPNTSATRRSRMRTALANLASVC